MLVDGTLSVDDLLIQNNALRTDLSVTLPEPLNSGGTQKANFSIDAQGHISGGATIAVINEAESVTGSSSTHFSLGSVATVHLRYLGLTLDFANLKSNSSVQVVSDLYLQSQEANRISLGDVAGGTVQPGLKVGFDGSVTWGNLTIAKAFDFDFDVVKLHVANVSFPAQQTGFAVSLSGGLSVNVEDVTGSVNFHDFVVTSKGDVQFSPTGVDSGTFTVANDLSLHVSGFGYSGTPTTLKLANGGLPAPGGGSHPDSTSVSVLSYLTFGGKFDINQGEVAGGVDRFLFYRATDASVHLVVQNALVSIANLGDIHLDLAYAKTPTGYQIAVGGQGKLYQYDGIVVGALERDGSDPIRWGLFGAANGLNINITPYIRLDGAGGGFFLRPRAEWIDMVRTAAGVGQDQSEGMVIQPDDGKWAAMFYGKVSFLQGVITGTTLTTVTNTQILMDGNCVILGQDGHLNGDHHVIIGLKNVYAEGTMDFKVNYDGVVTGNGPMQFYVYDADTWAVSGTSTISIVNYIKGNSDFFVGPPGFLVKTHVGANYSIAVISLDAGIDAQVWYLTHGSWGGYTSFSVSASVLGGLASATGTVQGSLIVNDGTPYLFAAADLKASALGQTWDGWAWVKFQNGQPSAGLGVDQSILDAINEAKSVADQMDAAKTQTQTALVNAQTAAAGPMALTNQELVTAYQNITGGLDNFWVVSQLAIAYYAELGQSPQTGESDYQDRVTRLLLLQNAPGDTLAIHHLVDSVSQAVSSAQTTQSQVQTRIAALALSIQPLTANASGSGVPTGSPLTSASFALPVTQDVVGPDGLTYRHATGGPGFSVDTVAAQNQQSAVTRARQQADAADLAIRQQIVALETGLGTVQSATAGSDPSALPALVGQYANVQAQAEHQYAAQADMLLQRVDWYRANLDSLASNRGAWNSDWITAKDDTLAQHQDPTLNTVASNRLASLGGFAGVDLLTPYQQALPLHKNDRFAWVQSRADSAGRQLWYGIAFAGMQTAAVNTANEFAKVQQAYSDRLTAIRNGHAALSTSLAGLYGIQAQATGALYDLYDRYLRARSTDTTPAQSTGLHTVTGTGKQIVPLADQLLDVSFLKTRRDQLAQDLTVPRINSVQVVPMASDRYATQLQFTWSGWHPSGVYEFEFADADPSQTAPTLLSNGPSGTLASYRFTPSATSPTTEARVFQVGVRGGAGYLGVGRTTYTLSFAPLSSQNAVVSGGSSVTVDNTPPSTPVVSFPGLAQRLDSTGTVSAWTNSPTRAAVAWSADDPESGVGQYEYAVWTTPTGTSGAGKGGIGPTQTLGTPVLQGFTAVGGRTDVTLDQVTLKAGQPIYVAVRATNGQGGVSGNGVSMPLRYDPTPPFFPAGATLVAPITVTLFTAPVHPLYAACPVSQPMLPGAPLPAFTLAPTVSTAWGGALTGSQPGGAPPRLTLTRPDATDNESGVANYYYHVTMTPTDTTFSASWTPLGSRNANLIVSGTPLDYVSQFYVVVVAQNSAGGVSKPLVYGPVRVSDPTPPSTPTFCAGPGSLPGQLAVLLTLPSVDSETSVVGYQYHIRTTKGVEVRPWPAGTGTDWPASGAAATYVASGALGDGQSYLVDVRAVNKQGELSPFATSGAVNYDASAPPNPGASVSVSGGIATMTAVAATDPQSGLSAVQWAIGTTASAADVIPWSAYPVASGGGTVTVTLPLTMPVGATLYLQARSVNAAGVPSTITVTSFSIPSPKGGLTPPPLTPPVKKVP